MRIQLLFRNYTFVKQQFEALKIGFGVFALRLVFGQRALRLLQDHLKRPRINLGQHIPLMYKLPFLKGHADQLPVYAAMHSHGIEGRHRA